MKVNVNLTGEINQMKEKGIKPNFSDLARRYGSDRKTVKKIWDNDGMSKRKASSRASRYDPYLEEISSLIARPSVSKKGVFMYLARKHAGEINWNYNTFKWYTRKKGIELRKAAVPHVAYETDPGEQMQVDWLCKDYHNQSYEKKRVMRSFC